jgi:hypothetical protein
LVFAIDVDAGHYEFLASFQVSPPARVDKVIKLGGQIQGVVIAEDAAGDELVVVFEPALQFVLEENHLDMTKKQLKQFKFRFYSNPHAKWATVGGKLDWRAVMSSSLSADSAEPEVQIRRIRVYRYQEPPPPMMPSLLFGGPPASSWLAPFPLSPIGTALPRQRRLC